MSEPDEEGSDDEALIEQVAGAYRAPSRVGLAHHPAWHDLSAEGRVRAHDRAAQLRRLEAGLDADGQSTTVKAVLARIAAG